MWVSGMPRPPEASVALILTTSPSCGSTSSSEEASREQDGHSRVPSLEKRQTL
eukprot:CAMPEP_0173411378 /NCGR_PEP_ID=MMETSP1356-20130122/76797_1 /TAXON_ID=77927 ORGANISM="Hemiselmis virescens, Strain PCC157" /NCGR_SAMPLE_ID=MMETSP1356 /ASSEMBLY_ACC=CAM_ASM_000847 /LENGTH=52 /DNA_ID=CAMNT_0014373127 /DNA_START=173 /DNA_END=331 /DNA_ORIENTATION=-